MEGSRTRRVAPTPGKLPRIGVAWALAVGMFALLSPVARAAGDPSVVFAPAPPAVQTTPVVSLSFDANVPTACRLDGGDWSPCSSPVGYDGLPNGSHTFDVTRADATGEAPLASASWLTDVLGAHAVFEQAPPPLTADGNTTFDFSGTLATATVTGWGSRGTAPGAFDDPSSIALDPSSGTLYVADRANDRIESFGASGALLAQWGTPGSQPGQFDAPAGIAVDASGMVFVADSGNDRIQEFDPGGTLLNVWGGTGSGVGEFRSPRGIAISPEGAVYVADMYNDRVQVFTEDGRVTNVWGRPGSKDGRFDYPADIALGPNGDVYVADFLNSRVQEFTADGDFVASIGVYGDGAGQMTYPYGLATDAAGNIYVADTYGGRIEVFDPKGLLLTTWDGSAPDGTRFDLPYDVAVASDGTVFAVDLGTDRVSALSTRAAALECSMDGAAFTPCVSPVTFTDLTYGTHSFAVRTVSPDGTLGAPASRTWTVTSGGPATAVEASATAPSAGETFDFTSDAVAGPGTVTFECRLDLADWTACTSPTSIPAPSPGPHTFDVRAIDGYGTIGDPASVTWTVEGAPVPSETPDPDPSPSEAPAPTDAPTDAPSPADAPSPSGNPSPTASSVQ